MKDSDESLKNVNNMCRHCNNKELPLDSPKCSSCTEGIAMKLKIKDHDVPHLMVSYMLFNENSVLGVAQIIGYEVRITRPATEAMIHQREYRLERKADGNAAVANFTGHWCDALLDMIEYINRRNDDGIPDTIIKSIKEFKNWLTHEK